MIYSPAFCANYTKYLKVWYSLNVVEILHGIATQSHELGILLKSA